MLLKSSQLLEPRLSVRWKRFAGRTSRAPVRLGYYRIKSMVIIDFIGIKIALSWLLSLSANKREPVVRELRAES
jgi:hypothetical protein